MKENTLVEQKILQAAKTVFIRKGYIAATMQEIAEEAGTSRPSLHYYFRTKEKLFEAIFDDILRFNMPVIAKTLISRKPIIEKMQQFVSLYTEALAQNPYMPTFICMEMLHQHSRLIEKIKSFGFRPDRILAVLDCQMYKEGIGHIQAIQLVLNTVSMCVFPIVVEPLLQEILKDKGKHSAQKVLEEQKHFISEFISNVLKHEKEHPHLTTDDRNV